jgi:hypothetical protein
VGGFKGFFRRGSDCFDACRTIKRYECIPHHAFSFIRMPRNNHYIPACPFNLADLAERADLRTWENYEKTSVRSGGCNDKLFITFTTEDLSGASIERISYLPSMVCD